MLFLHRLSATLFFSLGCTVFLAYVLLRNDVGNGWPAWYLHIIDLPLLLTGLAYGSLSILRSLQSTTKPSAALTYAIFVPTGLLFLLFVTLNFWPALT